MQSYQLTEICKFLYPTIGFLMNLLAAPLRLRVNSAQQ
ncbi:hypothetical protein Z949_2844 [Sulfitobacter guttiformis KCTC 32187]|nr:hypothetical protein Z949_2844 [Sulfitobacter guttiformis KCTC 32187]